MTHHRMVPALTLLLGCSDTDEHRPLPDAPGIDAPAVTADRIAFSSNRDGAQFDIFVLDLGTGVTTNVTNNPGTDRDPAWSPDGSKIAFSSDRDGSEDIYVMNADGSNVVNLTNRAMGFADHPQWSADGSKIVFQATDNTENDAEVFVMNADGTSPINLTNNTVADLQPALSPDGSRIAWHEFTVGVGHEIWTMAIDGTNPTRVVTASNGGSELPAWSADGTKITFTTDRDGNSEIYVVDATGANLTRLTTDPGGDGESAWAPDGSRIAFTTNRDGNSEIYAMNTDGTNPVNLTSSPADEFSPAWWQSK